MDFDIRQFYKEQKTQEEVTFTQNTGLRIRSSFQNYNEGTDQEEVFSLKTTSKKECFGIDYYGSISYMLPINNQEVLVFIFDNSLMPVINVLSNWSEPRIKVYEKHIPSLSNAFSNALQGNLCEISVFVDEEMLCFAKRVDYPFFKKIEEGYIADLDIISEVLSLVQFRNICVDEISSFEGFSEIEKKEIALKEGLAFVKKGLRYVRLWDYMSLTD